VPLQIKTKALKNNFSRFLVILFIAEEM